MHLLDLAVELERCLVVIVQRHRRAQVAADVEAVVGGEQQRCADRHLAFGDDLAVDLHGHVQRAAGFGYGVGRLDFDLHLAGGQLLLGVDFRPLDLEEVVFVAEHAVLHVAGQAAGKSAEGVEHAVGIGRDLGIDGDDVVLVAERRCGELRHPRDVAREGPLRVGRGDS